MRFHEVAALYRKRPVRYGPEMDREVAALLRMVCRQFPRDVSWEAAGEAANHVLRKLLEMSDDDFDGLGNVRHYFARAAQNKLRDYYRAEDRRHAANGRHREIREADLPPETLSTVAGETDSWLEAAEKRARIEEALRRADSEDDRQLLRMALETLGNGRPMKELVARLREMGVRIVRHRKSGVRRMEPTDHLVRERLRELLTPPLET